MSNINQQRRKELKSLERSGILRAEDVVAFAAGPDTALHSCFEWNDVTAAHQRRLDIARKLIRVFVVVEPKTKTQVSAYVSLKSDRLNPGGGYRTMVSVLSNADRREELLFQAFKEFEYWERKYQDLKELAPVFEAASKARTRRRKKRVPVGV